MQGGNSLIKEQRTQCQLYLYLQLYQRRQTFKRKLQNNEIEKLGFYDDFPPSKQESRQLQAGKPKELISYYKDLMVILRNQEIKQDICIGSLRTCVQSALNWKFPSSQNRVPYVGCRQKWGQQHYPVILTMVMKESENAKSIVQSSEEMDRFAKKVMDNLNQELRDIVGYQELIRDELMCFLTAFYKLEKIVVELDEVFKTAVQLLPEKI